MSDPLRSALEPSSWLGKEAIEAMVRALEREGQPNAAHYMRVCLERITALETKIAHTPFAALAAETVKARTLHEWHDWQEDRQVPWTAEHVLGELGLIVGRHPGWTEAGHRWLDAGAPGLNAAIAAEAPENATTTGSANREQATGSWTKSESRTAPNGLNISMFVYQDEDRTTAKFTTMGGPGEVAADPRPMLRRAISALQAELTDVDRCPAHSRLAKPAEPTPDHIGGLPDRLFDAGGEREGA